MQTENKIILTEAEEKRQRFFELFEFFLTAFENDITSGLEDGIYEESENVENVAKIAEAKTALVEQKNYKPEVYITIGEDGKYEATSATESMCVEVWEYDERAAREENDDTGASENWPLEDYDSEEEWNEKIKQQTEKGIIKQVD